MTRSLFIAALFLGMAGGVWGQQPKTQEDCSKRSEDAVQFSRCMDSIGLTSPLKIFCYAGTGSHCTEAQAEHYNDVTAFAPNSTVVGIRDHKPIYASPEPQPAPLKCGKPQELYFDAEKGDLYVCEAGYWRKRLIEAGGSPPCDQISPIHIVTEKEWQELMARLKALEMKR